MGEGEAENPRRLIKNYIVSPRTPLIGSDVRPLFVFKMSSANGEVIFLPELTSIESTLRRLLALPSKLQHLHQIDGEVVPLIGLPEVSLCSKQTAPHIFALAHKVKEDVDGKTEFIRDRMNAKGPNAPPLNTSWTGEGPNALVILPIGEPVRDLDPGTVGRLL